MDGGLGILFMQNGVSFAIAAQCWFKYIISLFTWSKQKWLFSSQL